MSETDDLVKLSFFVEIGKAIAGAATIEATFQEVMKQIGSIFAPVTWSLFLVDPKTGELQFKIVTGPGSAALLGKRLPKGQGVVGWIAENAQSLIIEDVTKDPRFTGEFDKISQFKTKSIIGVPLVTRGKVLGVIELINRLDDQNFRPIDLKILQTIADFAAIAIEKNYYLHALRKMSSSDPLTGLANRRTFDQVLAREQERVTRTGLEYSVLLLDVNHFKQINDSLGHIVGDQVLKELAAILLRSIRKVDLAARLGGDEFVVLMPETGREAAMTVKQRILEDLAGNQARGGIAFTVSIGVNTAREGSSESVIESADKDMYREKQKRLTDTIEDLQDHLQDFMNEQTLGT